MLLLSICGVVWLMWIYHVSLLCHFNITFLSRSFVSKYFSNLKVFLQECVCDMRPSPVYVKFDPVNELRPGENKVEYNAGQSCVPHILRSVPVRVVVITEDTYKKDEGKIQQDWCSTM